MMNILYGLAQGIELLRARLGDDPYKLERFVTEQDPVFESVLRELEEGRKQSHWMWFVFPQMRGLGASSMAQRFAIGSKGEARAYLAHPVLGPRLRRCVELMMDKPETCEDILGPIDAMKLRSCLTLFGQVEPGGVWDWAIAKLFDGHADALTLGLWSKAE